MKKLFKVILLAISLCAVLLFVGCSDALAIEGRAWRFTLAQEGDGGVVACSQEMSGVYPGAEVVGVSISVENGAIVLTRGAQVREYDYSVCERNAEAIVYSLESGGKGCGLASVGITSYADGTKELTLILTDISAGGISLYFVAPAE